MTLFRRGILEKMRRERGENEFLSSLIIMLHTLSFSHTYFHTPFEFVNGSFKRNLKECENRYEKVSVPSITLHLEWLNLSF